MDYWEGEEAVSLLLMDVLYERVGGLHRDTLLADQSVMVFLKTVTTPMGSGIVKWTISGIELCGKNDFVVYSRLECHALSNHHDLSTQKSKRRIQSRPKLPLPKMY